MKKSIFAAAQDNWPEDEASQTFETVKQDIEDLGLVAAIQALGRNVEHMKNVFLREVDGEDLWGRYKKELNNLLVAHVGENMKNSLACLNP